VTSPVADPADRFAVGRHNGQKVLALPEGVGEYRGTFRQTIAVERVHCNSGVSARTILAVAEERLQDDGAYSVRSSAILRLVCGESAATRAWPEDGVSKVWLEENKTEYPVMSPVTVVPEVSEFSRTFAASG
jgi:hypothetical protein